MQKYTFVHTELHTCVRVILMHWNVVVLVYKRPYLCVGIYCGRCVHIRSCTMPYSCSQQCPYV